MNPSNTLVLDPSGNTLLQACTRAKGHCNITTCLPSLAALGSPIVVEDKVSLISGTSIGREVSDGTVASRRLHSDSSLISGAAAAIVSGNAVNEGDVVPEGIGDSIFELSDAVGPKVRWVAGNLEGFACTAGHAFYKVSPCWDEGLGIGQGGPITKISDDHHQCRSSKTYKI